MGGAVAVAGFGVRRRLRRQTSKAVAECRVRQPASSVSTQPHTDPLLLYIALSSALVHFAALTAMPAPCCTVRSAATLLHSSSRPLRHVSVLRVPD